jgi:hypothetical protein
MDEKHERRKAWTFFGILLGFKIWTALLVLVFFAWTAGTLSLVIMTHIPYLLVLGGMVVIPLAFYARLLRVRAKREKLRHAEWNLEPVKPVRPSGRLASLRYSIRYMDGKKMASYLILVPGPPAAVFHLVNERYGLGLIAASAFIAAFLVFHTNLVNRHSNQVGQEVRSNEAEHRSRFD